MKQQKLVSIAVAIYNKEKEITKCLNTIINQTYLNIEIILVNDGSTDKSKNICENYASIDNRIIIINKPNEGLEMARFTAINMASGEYITFIDADDYISINAIEILVKTLEINDADVSLGTMFRILGPFKKIRGYQRDSIITQKEFIDNHAESFCGWGTFPLTLCSKMYKTSLFKDKDVQSVGITYGEDLCLNMKIIPKAKNIATTATPVYYYRWGGMTNNLQEKVFEDAIKQYHLKQNYFLDIKRNDCIYKSNVEMINYFSTFVDICIIRYPIKSSLLREKIDCKLHNRVILDIISDAKNENMMDTEFYKALYEKNIDKIISLKKKGLIRKKLKLYILKRISQFL